MERLIITSSFGLKRILLLVLTVQKKSFFKYKIGLTVIYQILMRRLIYIS
uniref:Uncharacterized protein n=1 Tax=Amphimedon queenslandica TaxID=400682 RepID=A0A1X7SW33_AMPQE